MAATGEVTAWPTERSAYQLKDEIGQGAFAKVWRTYCPAKDQYVAVKIISLEKLTTSMEDIQSEVRTMKMCRHANVLQLYCCFVVDSDLWLVMPLMDKGSCFYILRALRKRGSIEEHEGLPEEWIQVILRETLKGLAYLHENKQIHRDVKAGNILVDSAGSIQIGDFGVAGWMNDSSARSDGKRETFVGTPCWMAPEVMEQSRGYDEKADIWSLGITALELARGYAPYSKFAPMQVLIKTLREPSPSLDSYEVPPGKKAPKFSSKFSAFVAKCLEKDPTRRPSAKDLLQERYIKNANKTEKFAAEFLAKVPTVAPENTVSLADKPAGYAATEFELGQNDGAAQKPSNDEQYVPGTTWDFSGYNGQQVGNHDRTSSGDLNKLAEELEQMGGENVREGDDDESASDSDEH